MDEVCLPRIPSLPSSAFPHIRPLAAAAAGLDTALWDLRGKEAGVRVADLIGSTAAAEVDVYASAGCTYDWRDRPSKVIDDVLQDVESGYRTCKVRLGTRWEWDAVTPDRFISLMCDLRSNIPENVALAVDGNSRLDFDAAALIANALGNLGFVWFEEPMPLNVEAYQLLRQQSAIPISGGENYTTLEQFRPFIEMRALDIVQPDVAVTGISEAVRIAELAASHGVGICTHNWHNDLMTVANAQFLAGVGAQHPLERCTLQGPLQEAVLSRPLEIEDGRLRLPKGPGLGVSLACDLEQRFPHIEGHYAIEVARCAT